MRDVILRAKEEIKRADHLIFVSLKYTRTVDVIKSIIERLINTYDVVVSGILEKAEEEMKIFEVPKVPKQRVEEVLKLYPDDIMKDHLQFFLFLKKLDKAEYTCACEYRKHVHMTATFPKGEAVQVNMDDLKEYFVKTKDFIIYIENLHVIPGDEDR
jgi:hypothetical protein